jgi:8-oxo-dGTP pyrophosphatase MutT (NUDIX family)
MSVRFKPNVTVAAVIEQHGRFLLVEEETPQGLRLNNPAGHLEQGESLIQACARETLEETAYVFEPIALIGIYLSNRTNNDGQVKENIQNQTNNWVAPSPPTYLRFAFSGHLGSFQEGRALDTGIVGTVWLSHAEILLQAQRLRSPMVLRCIADYLAGQCYPLDLVHTALETD